MFKRLKKWLAAGAVFGAASAIGLVVASQSNLWSPITGTVSGLALTQNLNSALDAVNTCNSGASAPTNQGPPPGPGVPSLGNCWLNTTTGAVQYFDGTGWLTFGYIDATNHVFTPVVGGNASTSVTAATTTNLCGASGAAPTGTFLTITSAGGTSITGFGSNCAVGQVKILVFAGASPPSLAYDAAQMILPGGATKQTVAGDTAVAVYLGSGNWRVAIYALASGRAVQSFNSVIHTAKIALYTVVSGDCGNWIDATSGTWTLTLTAPATLSNGCFFYFSNTGTGNITIQPATGQIDGLASFVSYPGEARFIQSDGAAFQSIVLSPYNIQIPLSASPFTFTIPPKYASHSAIICGGGGQGGGGGINQNQGSGGGGGGGGGYCNPGDYKTSDLSGATGCNAASCAVTIGAGGTGAGLGATVNATSGANGSTGGTSSFGASGCVAGSAPPTGCLAFAYGGGGGGGTLGSSAGGGGGGLHQAGGTPTVNTSLPGSSEFVTGGPLGNAATFGCAGATGGNPPTIFNCAGGGAGGGAGRTGQIGAGQATVGGSTGFHGPGGGSGANVNSANTGGTGGAGGLSIGCNVASAGGTAGNPGTAGGNTAADFPYHPGCGGGGGGGGTGTTTTGGNGGAGTNAGGGGGGGGAGGTTRAGNGGNGGDGFAWIRGNI